MRNTERFSPSEIANHTVHIRTLTNGRVEYLRTDKPTKRDDALKMRGWKMLTEREAMESNAEAARSLDYAWMKHWEKKDAQKDPVDMIAEIGSLKNAVLMLLYELRCAQGRLIESDNLSDLHFYDARFAAEVEAALKLGEDAIRGGRNAR